MSIWDGAYDNYPSRAGNHSPFPKRMGVVSSELPEGSELSRSRRIKSSDEIEGLPEDLRSVFLRNIIDAPYGFSEEQRVWLISNSTAPYMVCKNCCYFEEETDLVTFLLKFK